MIASGITREAIEAAAAEIGVRAEISATLNAKGTRHRVKLYPVPGPDCYTPSGRRRKGDAGDAPYQRESVGWGTAGRRVHAVCWHGFRDFFRACFERFPEATFRTALDTWRGSADFEARFRESGIRQTGPRIARVSHVDACRCPDVGSAS